MRAGTARRVVKCAPWVLGALAFAPALALAGNGLHPRTYVEWNPTPQCMTIIDRSVSPTWHLEYGIPYEDTMLTPDEVDDSRTHQFLALCRGHSRQTPIPEWITMADVTDADNHGLAEDTAFLPENIWELNTEWPGCWYRINEDNERRPITFEAAAEGVDWDTAAVPAGVYVIEGYTYEPAFNVYQPRPGVIKVVDSVAEKHAVGPALAIMNGTDIADPTISMFELDPFVLEGCVDALEGSTLSVYWSYTEDGSNLDWQPYELDIPLEEVSDGSTFAIELPALLEAITFQIAVRVDITDPMDRTFTGHTYWLVSVLAGTEPLECDDSNDSSGFVTPNCTESDSSDSTDDSASATATATASATDTSSTGTQPTGQPPSTTDTSTDTGGGEGCACRTGRRSPGGAPWALALSTLALLGHRRRRRP